MIKRLLTGALCCMAACLMAQTPHTFEPGKGTFLLDGKPFVVKAAELHYPRIPRPYWDRRIKMVKALGMNTVCLYTFWNTHEPRPGEFDFSGQNDLREFIKLCQENGLYVILRPGPYVCAEWEMGGLPWWLLKDKDIALREDDPRFLEKVENFEKKVAEQVADLTIDKGGPVIMVQVENEYGSYGKNKKYVSAIRDMLREEYGPDVTLFQCDWSSNFLDNGLDDLVWTLNFGTGADVEREFEPLLKVRPDAPLMCSEYWSGWFDKWGAGHETRPAEAMVKGIDDMLSRGISFSLYMTHGGTNWGHWAGANSPGFAPDVTSYDYDAPINEQGAPTEKYYLLRDVMRKYAGTDSLPPIPAIIPTGTVAPFTVTRIAPLDSMQLTYFSSERPVGMEEADQGFGSMLYTTTLAEGLPEGAVLHIEHPGDFVQVFIDGNYIGSIDRRISQTELELPSARPGAKLELLTEAMGRINFGRAIKDFKGITGDVTVSAPGGPAVALTGWETALLPDDYGFYKSLTFRDVEGVPSRRPGRLPAGVYTATFTVDDPKDTYLDFSTWGKGLVYVNGHPLGRIWEIGPQQTLYTPGCWLNKGENELLVFDIAGPRETTVQGLDTPIIDMLQTFDEEYKKEAVLNNMRKVKSGKLKKGNGWQTVKWKHPVTARYLIFKATDAQDRGDTAAIAEIYLLGADGKRIARENWKPGSWLDMNPAGNHTPDKTFDLQESTYWESAPGKKFPHTLVIDLGKEETLSGLEILPRMEKGAPGATRKFSIYTAD